ncbi:zinc finger FYVE domain-containing protein 26-like [Antedon mediterranea]|uniref:zinc finger FYVE domain-containing protein 26-like n=1 Tax=Antedon mediterranea TaxID=105859 RepID=UPI003AF5843D
MTTVLSELTSREANLISENELTPYNARPRPAPICRSGRSVLLRHSMLSFRKYFQLGQWELARACALTFWNLGGGVENSCCGKVKFQDGDVHKNPNLGLDELVDGYAFENFDNEERLMIEKMMFWAIQNPEKYSFGSQSVVSPEHLSLLCCQFLQDKSVHTQTSSFLHHLQFSILLLMCKNIGFNKSTLKELYQYFYFFERKDESSTRSQNSQMSKSCQRLLQDILIKDPILGCTIINFLNSFSSQTSSKAIVLSTITTLINMVKSSKAIDKSLYLKIYDLIAKTQWPLDETTESVKNMGRELLNLAVSQPCLELHTLYSCIVYKEDKFVQLCSRINNEFMMEYRRRLIPKDKLESGEDIANGYAMLGMNSMNRESVWKRLYFQSWNHKQHVLEQIVLSSLSFIKEEMFGELADLLAPQELSNLRVLVVLLGLGIVTTSSSASRLLQAVDFKSNDSLLSGACQRLSQSIELIKWCMDKTSTVDEDGERRDVEVNLLSGQSALSVIHHCGCCFSLEPADVIDALSGTFTEDEMISIAKNKQTADKVRSIEQARDLSVYMSFIATMEFAKAVARPNITPTLTQQTTVFQRSLIYAKENLRNIYPLTFRVETLENIFSLLFVRFDDQRSSRSGSDCDEPLGDGSFGFVRQGRKNTSSSDLYNSEKLESGGSSSSLSGLSNQMTSHGFLASPAVIDIFLKVFKECLNDLSDTCLQKSDGSSLGDSKELHKHLKCSISQSELKQRIARLEKCTNEALWRFQLVSEKVKGQDRYSSHVDDELGRLIDEEVQKEKEELTRQKKNVQPGSPYSLSTSSDRRKRKISHYAKSSAVSKPATSDGIISYMLSTQEMLVRICMVNGKFRKAKQVIDMFGMDKGCEVSEVHFSQHWNSAIEQVQSLDVSAIKRLSAPTSQSSRLGVIANIANSAVSAMSAGNVVDETLARLPSNLYKPLDLNPYARDKLGLVELYSHLQGRNISCMVALDLACTASKFYETSLSLLDRAESSTVSNTAIAKGNDLSMLGVGEFVQLLYGALRVQKDAMHSDVLKQSVHELLLCGSRPLQSSNLERSVRWHRELFNSVMDFKQSLSPEKSSKSPKKSPLKRMHQKDGVTTASVQKCSSKLMQVLDDDVTKELKVSKYYSHGEEHSQKQVNYLKTICDHVNTLASVLLESPDRQSGTQPKPSNPFSVLSKGPHFELGKLMFHDNISPSRLETIAKSLKLDLVDVMVKSCCPTISLYLPPVIKSQMPDGQLVLNGGEEWTEKARHPATVVKDLLSRLIRLMKNHIGSSNTEGIFDMGGAFLASGMPEWFDIITATCELQAVDLDLLITNEEKICFFTNLLNLLLAHSAIGYIHGQIKVNMEQNPLSHTRHGSLGCKSGLRDWNVKEPACCSSSTLDRLLYYSNISYKVGQLGVISAFHLRFSILHNELPAPASLGPILKKLDAGLERSSKWKKYLPESESRLLFVVADSCISSPILQVLEEDQLYEQLSDAMRSYLDSHVLVNKELMQVTIPQQVAWFRKDFTGKNLQENIESGRIFEGLIHFLIAHVSEELGTSLDSLILSCSPKRIEAFTREDFPDEPTSKINGLKIKINTMDFNFGYTFSYASGYGQRMQRRSSAPDLSQLADEYEHVHQKPVFSPNKETLQYMEARNRFIWTISKVVGVFDGGCGWKLYISPEAINDVTEALISGDTSSEELEDFPVLQKYLQYFAGVFLSFHNENHKTGEAKSLLDACGNSYSYIFGRVDSDTFQETVREDLNKVLENGKWQQTLDILDLLIHFQNIDSSDLVTLRDYVLIGLHVDSRSLDVAASKKYLMQVRNHDLLVNSVLTSLSYYSSGDCLELLEHCFFQLSPDSPHVQLVQQKYKEMQLYSKISEYAKSFNPRSCDIVTKEESEDLWNDLVSYKRWQYIAEQSYAKPKQVLAVILSCHEYETALTWADLHNSSIILKQLIEKKYLVSLLKESHPNIKIYQILESTNDKQYCFSLCKSLLETSGVSLHGILSIVQFVTTHLADHIPSKQLQEFNATTIGVNMLLCMSSVTQAGYEHLMSKPLLILEQLIMNSNLVVASNVMSVLTGHLDGQPDMTCWKNEIDQLVSKYAREALVINTIAQTWDDCFIEDEPVQCTVPDDPETSSMMDEMKDDLMHQLPSSPPKKEDWVKDMDVTFCMVCKTEKFSMFNRRHHCRRCGRVVCWRCSQLQAIVKGYGEVPVRICDDCYRHFIMPRRISVRPDMSPRRMSGSSLRPGSDRRTSRTPSPSPRSTTPLLLPRAGATHFKLKHDSVYNKTVRDEFCYDQAPSTSLCISILDLHTDPSECGVLVLELCQSLSENLRPLKPGVPNPEIDYNLLISMIKTLLFDAKLKFMKAEAIHKIEQCDTYISLVDLLSNFVTANCLDIPSIQQLTKPDTARLIRDRLLESERLNLAMEVSTKCRLDTGAVWASWGMSCLRSGDYEGAKEKFKRVLKTIDDKNSLHPPSKLLSDILQFLQSVNTEAVSVQEISKSSPSYIREYFADPKQITSVVEQMYRAPTEQCKWYIETFGTHLLMVEFYMKHDYLPKALLYIIAKKCDASVFIEGIIITCVKEGGIYKLHEQMMLVDSSLNMWSKYLTATCRYLSSKRYMHVLYQFQVFMKDYVRASMTCIRFFQDHVKSYADLFERLHYLDTAKHHLKMVSDSRGSSPGHQMSLSASDVAKHIKTIEMQLEVTKCLHQVEQSEISNMLSNASKQNVATLFGGKKEKEQVAYMMLMIGLDMDRSFNLGYKIIQIYRLSALLVFTRVGQALSEKRKVKEIGAFMEKLRNNKYCDADTGDSVLGACVKIVVSDPQFVKETEYLVKLMKKYTNQISAYILCGKLKSAYLIAVKSESVDDVKRIAAAAHETNQFAVKSICDKWLASKGIK